MKRLFLAYKEVISIIFNESPWIVVLAFACTIMNGILTPLGIYVNQNMFDGGLTVARGDISFSEYVIYLVLFIVIALLPELLDGIIFNYVQPYSLLIVRTAYRARMLKKLKTMKYEHYENESTIEIIDKSFYRVEGAIRHLWPMYIYWRFSALIASVGTLCYVMQIQWWLVFTILVPFLLETYVSTKNNYNIYAELETYWKKERKYGVLGKYLRSREFTKEIKANGNADYLINTYKDRLNERNRDYEKYFFKNIRKILLGGNITKIGSILNVIILLVLFFDGQITVGLFIAVASVMYDGIYNDLDSVAGFFKWSGMHIKTYEFCDKFFALSDEAESAEVELPETFDIEFKDVWFKYPGTKKDVLKGLTLKINTGEVVSIVGENGEGKSTIIKLLLGLFTPDRGEILVGGISLAEYPLSVRAKMFGPIFQDFSKYSITVKENIGVGDIDNIDNVEKINKAAKKAKVDQFAESFEKGYETLLGRDFEDGVDISGGQWQRIAMARAFMGNKPILVLDEPTSQLDPVAEAELYGEFMNMIENKTAVLITHRLGSTMISDKIFVIHDGRIAEAGTHTELMQIDGIYSKMFNSQKQWYKHEGECHNYEK